MSCADCDGVIGGDNYPDPCGVCFGDGSSCADCAGCPNSGAVVDRCGVCNGDNACLGCDGELVRILIITLSLSLSLSLSARSLTDTLKIEWSGERYLWRVWG